MFNIEIETEINMMIIADVNTNLCINNIRNRDFN